MLLSVLVGGSAGVVLVLGSEVLVVGSEVLAVGSGVVVGLEELGSVVGVLLVEL